MNQQTEQKILDLLRAKKSAIQIKDELGLNSTSAIYETRNRYPLEFPKYSGRGRKTISGVKKVRVAARVNPETKRKADEEAARTGATVCRVYSNVLDDWGCGDDR